MTLRQLVDNWLKSNGGGYRKLAQDVGVSAGTIANIVAGYAPSRLSVLEKFAAYFKVDVAALLKGASDGEGEGRKGIGTRLQPAASQTLSIMEQLNPEEQEALVRCASALRQGSVEIRQHLINQMKIVEKAVQMDKKRSRRSIS